MTLRVRTLVILLDSLEQSGNHKLMHRICSEENSRINHVVKYLSADAKARITPWTKPWMKS
jgi:hypothetical protein